MSYLFVIEKWEREKKELYLKDFFKIEKKYPYCILYGKGNYIIFGEKPLKVFRDFPNNLKFKRFGEKPQILPDIIGFVSYEKGYEYDSKLPDNLNSNFPLSLFFLYKNLKIYSKKTKTLYQCTRETEHYENAYLLEKTKKIFKAKFISTTEDKKSYCEKVRFIKEEIKKGNVYQVNLTRQEEWAFSGDISQFAYRLYQTNPASFSAILEFIDSGNYHSIVSSSPERFFKIGKGKIITEPIKGTINRGNSKKEDLTLKTTLKNSKKDSAELAMITDLLRNDLTKVCISPSVQVKHFKKLLTLSNVHHLVSIIEGKLKTNNMKEIFENIFPGGSITGCPKLSSMQYILKLEKLKRNIYTGSIGWYRADGKQGDFNIAIRTAYTINDKLYFGVGGGIVIDSNEKNEYLETVYKAQSIRKCLENS
ncbi:anthranilate synthase component I [Thermotomaculum hydrothermale]|uniref:Anthranilate synthase component I n=1 Tax=Thermotomaculum hydrothermale TaxID=981385 RepID=A0A7R6PP10_9BACT|nr:anthranilate synthase component I family protein [Thermotomaculum hydrothermale]BBB33188.1 anthranilate synthase component I [Thermotomaculum hydrothermale]